MATSTLSAAQSQVSPSLADATKRGVLAKTYIKHFDTYKAGVAWCACFAGWAAEKAGYKLSRPFWGNVDNLAQQLMDKGWKKNTSPKVGDTFINPGLHTGVVESANNSQITSIEGNTQGGNNWDNEWVRRIVRNRSTLGKYYFLTPPKNTTAPTPPAVTPSNPVTRPKFPLPDGYYYGPLSGPMRAVSGMSIKRADGLRDTTSL